MLSRIRDPLLALAASPVFAVASLAALAVRRVRTARITPCKEQAPASLASVVIMAASGDPVSLRGSLSRYGRPSWEGAGVGELLVLARPEMAGEVAHVLPGARVLPLEAGSGDPWLPAVRAAANEVVILLTAGCSIEPESCRRLVSWFADGRLFAVAPLIIGQAVADGETRTGRTRGEIRFGGLRLWDAPVREGSNRETPILWARRGEGAFRRSAYLALDGVASLYASSEAGELDLALRAAKSGLRLIQDAGAVLRLDRPRDVEAIPPDLWERDIIALAWRHLGGTEVPGFAVHFVARILACSLQGRLNLRPLRLAISTLPQIPRLRLLSPSIDAPPPGEASAGGVEEGRNDRRPTALRILMVCPQLPYPPTHGSAVRMWNLLKQLSARNRVDLLTFVEQGMPENELAEAVAAMRPYCGEVRTVVRRPFNDGPNPLDRSIHVEMFDCPEMRETLTEMANSGRYDAIQYDKTEMGQYLLPKPAPPQFLVEHVVFYHAYRRQFFRGIRTPLHRLVEYLKLRRFELGVCRQADGVITMSEVDTGFLRSQLPGHPWISDVPNGVDTGYYEYQAVMPRNHDLLFIGNYYHSPNVDGVRFFLREVLPAIRRSEPDCRLVIVGLGPYGALPEVQGEEAVICMGLVPDTRTFMGGCSVLVAPILAGSGTRLKLLEAMSAGIPIVSTTLGAEGLGAVPGRDFLAADAAPDFARQVVSLLNDPETADALRRNARRLVEEKFDWAVAGRRLEETFRTLPKRIPGA